LYSFFFTVMIWYKIVKILTLRSLLDLDLSRLRNTRRNK
jgi:hypothetical protein